MFSRHSKHDMYRDIKSVISWYKILVILLTPSCTACHSFKICADKLSIICFENTDTFCINNDYILYFFIYWKLWTCNHISLSSLWNEEEKISINQRRGLLKPHQRYEQCCLHPEPFCSSYSRAWCCINAKVMGLIRRECKDWQHVYLEQCCLTRLMISSSKRSLLIWCDWIILPCQPRFISTILT